MSAESLDQIFDLGDLTLACGQQIPQARLVYRQIGVPNADGSNLILVPTSYGARVSDLAWLAGPVLDPQRWCIVIVGQFGNGQSSSPSHGVVGMAEQGWLVRHSDNVAAQRRLLTVVYGVQRIPLIYGWSMGAQQAYQWAVTHPDTVERLCCVCGTARTSVHNQLFCLSLRQALIADPQWNGAGFDAIPDQGLRTFAFIYASWAVSQTHYSSVTEPLAQHVEQQWLPHYRRHDPRDLIAMLDTWMAHDVAAGGDLSAALAGVTARAAVVAGSHDLYFTVDDMAADVARMADAQLHVMRSTLGHRAGNPHSSPPEARYLRQIVDQLLAS
ncbi:MAG: alpha/beta fold hydrolase [Cyanobacteria bacterium K_DeepCast_35m_m2_023]|nr:alpha/beta fold hydrolase [Cyanobacteria bacterium K_DeepCast_35m_m2_023]